MSNVNFISANLHPAALLVFHIPIDTAMADLTYRRTLGHRGPGRCSSDSRLEGDLLGGYLAQGQS